MDDNNNNNNNDDKKKKKGFSIDKDILAQNEDMLGTTSDQMMSAPHYSLDKPKDTHYARAHPDVFTFTCANLADAEGEAEELYILQFNENHDDHIRILQNPKLVTFVPMITPQGNFFFWPCKQMHPNSGRAEMKAHASGRKCYRLAQEEWVKIYWDAKLKMYVTEGDPTVNFGEPEWPTKKWNMPMEEIFTQTISAIGNFIDDIDHTKLKRYRGEIV